MQPHQRDRVAQPQRSQLATRGTPDASQAAPVLLFDPTQSTQVSLRGAVVHPVIALPMNAMVPAGALEERRNKIFKSHIHRLRRLHRLQTQMQPKKADGWHTAHLPGASLLFYENLRNLRIEVFIFRDVDLAVLVRRRVERQICAQAEEFALEE